MKSFYGRKNELKALEQIEKNSLNSANFTVITGRRRIGKTELLKKYIEKKGSLTSKEAVSIAIQVVLEQEKQ